MSGWMLVLGLATLFAGLTAVILLVGWTVRDRRQIAASMEAIDAIGGTAPRPRRPETEKPFAERVTGPATGWLANVARTFSGGNWTRNTSVRLAKAGNPAGWDPERILSTKTLAGMGLGGFVFFVLLISGNPVGALVWGGVFGVIGFFVPDLLLVNRGQHRAEAIQRALPDAIDLLTITVESGLTFDAGLTQVAQNTDGPLPEEFTRVLREVQFGSSRAVALKALADRTDVEDLRIFLNSMVQAERLGIPIADVLRVQSSEMRLKRSQRIEEQAMKLPVKLVFPLLLGIMPALFIVILGPAVINIYLTMIAP